MTIEEIRKAIEETGEGCACFDTIATLGGTCGGNIGIGKVAIGLDDLIENKEGEIRGWSNGYSYHFLPEKVTNVISHEEFQKSEDDKFLGLTSFNTHGFNRWEEQNGYQKI